MSIVYFLFGLIVIYSLFIMDFKISSRNISGLNEPLKQKEIRNFVLKEDLKIFGILETKVKHTNEQTVFEKIFKNKWAFVSNSDNTTPGCIWLCWDPNFCAINPIYQSDQIIFCKIDLFDSDISFATGFVYAENKHILRVPLFGKIVELSSQMSNTPSVWLGDFNAIHFPSEKIGGSKTWSNAKELCNLSLLCASLVDIFIVAASLLGPTSRLMVTILPQRLIEF